MLRARSVAVSLSSGIQLANRDNLIHSLLEELQTLGGCKRKHPADQRQVHAVRAKVGAISRIVGVKVFYYLCIDGALNSSSVTSASQVMPPRLTLNCAPPSLGDAPCQCTTPGGQ